jgi:uncharacterized protein YfiM (DUF2279 family)
MKPAAIQLLSSLASLPLSFRSLLSIFIISFFFTSSIYSQDSTISKDTAISSDQLELTASQNEGSSDFSGISFNNFAIRNATLKWDKLDTASGKKLSLTPKQIKGRTRLITAANIVGYGGVMAALASAWYADYTKTKLHSFNDSREWQQMDKVGHYYGTWIESRANNELWKWTGMKRKKRIWISGLTSFAFQTTIEYLDGKSAEWGWSWADFGANVLGSGTFIAQELTWDEQRIKLKWSFHKKKYADGSLNERSNELFGKSLPERFLKDYNGQTYWASVNIKSFFPKSKWPDWLCVSLGYGADGMFGGEQNIAKDANGNLTFDRQDIKRYRQWYLAPDIDLSKIKTNKKAIKVILTILSAFKFPAPSLEFSNGRFRLNALHF